MPTVFVPEDELAALRREVMTKYGKLYGKVREEMKKAVEERVRLLREENQKAGRQPPEGAEGLDLEKMSDKELEKMIKQLQAMQKKKGKK